MCAHPHARLSVTVAVVFLDSPFKEEFVPVDELTRKKENEVAKVEEQVRFRFVHGFS